MRCLGRPKATRQGALRASSDLRRLAQCQKEWRGFKPTCCDSPAVAVPIGCNHRLCPLCASQRLERYRGPVREMLAAMENPSFLTLTVPNCGRLTTETFKQIRNWWKAFYRANEAFLRGGVYAIEATFNRLTRTWHPHLHIIFDSPYRLSGISRATFVEAKLRLEFSWVRITSSSTRRVFKKSEFARWRTETSQHRKGSPWNKIYRRVLDLRAVKRGDGAANECIKYITKTTRFLDIPEAVEEFLIAVRGVRVTQSFGTYYNWKLEEEDEPIKTEAVLGEIVLQRQSYLRCECGQNQFLGIGLFSESRVLQQADGRWIIDPQYVFHRCRDRLPPEEQDMALA